MKKNMKKNFLVADPIAEATVPSSSLASQGNFPGQLPLLRSNNKAGEKIPPALEVAKEVSYPKVKAPADQEKFSRIFSRQPLTRLVASDLGIKHGSNPVALNTPAASWHEQSKAQVLSPLRTRPSPITLEFRVNQDFPRFHIPQF